MDITPNPDDNTPEGRSKRAKRRVVESHRLALRAFQMAGVFGAVAAVWSVVTMVRGGSWWGPLHAFVAGAVLLSISGASQMFTITWAASPAPSSRVTTGQRWLVAGGVVAVLWGVSTRFDPLVWTGALAVAGGLGVLGFSIRAAVRASLLRRFDLSARFYLLAFACGVVGVTLGALLGTGAPSGQYRDIRVAHSHLNLVGLVGLTIIGTLPTFLPTVAHHRSVSGKEAVLAWRLSALGVALMAGGLVGGPRWVGAGTVIIGTSGLVLLTGIVGRLGRKGTSQLQFVQVGLGTAWLGVWALVDGARLAAGGQMEPFSPVTAAAVVAGVAQILVGSLAYLVPVVMGPPIGPALATMTARPVIAVALPNLAGLALVTGFPLLAVASAATWVIDFAWRLFSVIRGPGPGGTDGTPGGDLRQ